MKPHKWAKEIKAWADGAEIEVYDVIKGWIPETDFYWIEDYDYRIKPQPMPKGLPGNKTPTGIKEPQYLYVMQNIDDKSVHLFTQKYETVYHHYIGKIKLEVDDD